MEFIIPYLQYLERASIPGVLIIIALILYKTGIWDAIAQAIKIKEAKSDSDYNQVNIKTNDGRLRKLEQFQFKQETNHNHDLEDLKQWRVNIDEWRLVVDKQLNQIGNDTAYLRGKVDNAK